MSYKIYTISEDGLLKKAVINDGVYGEICLNDWQSFKTKEAALSFLNKRRLQYQDQCDFPYPLIFVEFIDE